MHLDRPVLKIELFGSFCVKYGDRTLSDISPRATRVWTTLKYLALNPGSYISSETLINVLWPNEEVENPIKALQNLVYRLRSIIPSDKPGDEHDYIKFAGGAYSLSSEYPIEIDTVEFEKLCSAAIDKGLPVSEKIELCRRALKLYRGELLENSHGGQWVIVYSNYYHRMAFGLLDEYITTLEKEGMYTEVISACEKATSIDLFEESYHARMINAMVALGRNSQAIAHYDYVTTLLEKELGITPSEALVEAGSGIFADVADLQYDMNTVFNFLQGGDERKGAFYCNPNVFKQLFQLECRAIRRTGQAMMVVMLTVSPANDTPPDTKLIGKAMLMLKRASINLLRSSDVITQFSSTQLLIMMPTLTVEDADMVASRVTSRFFEEYGGDDIRISCRIRPINSDTVN